MKNLIARSYSVPLKIPKTKLEVIPPKYAEGDSFQVKTTPSQQIFPEGIARSLLVIFMDPILNFLERAGRELSENVYFYPL